MGHIRNYINDIADVRDLIAKSFDIVGFGFHPDKSYTEYKDKNGNYLFENPDLWDKKMDEAFDLCDDLKHIEIFTIALSELKKYQSKHETTRNHTEPVSAP